MNRNVIAYIIIDPVFVPCKVGLYVTLNIQKILNKNRSDARIHSTGMCGDVSIDGFQSCGKNINLAVSHYYYYY